MPRYSVTFRSKVSGEVVFAAERVAADAESAKNFIPKRAIDDNFAELKPVDVSGCSIEVQEIEVYGVFQLNSSEEYSFVKRLAESKGLKTAPQGCLLLSVIGNGDWILEDWTKDLRVTSSNYF